MWENFHDVMNENFFFPENEKILSHWKACICVRTEQIYCDFFQQNWLRWDIFAFISNINLTSSACAEVFPKISLLTFSSFVFSLIRDREQNRRLFLSYCGAWSNLRKTFLRVSALRLWEDFKKKNFYKHIFSLSHRIYSVWHFFTVRGESFM